MQPFLLISRLTSLAFNLGDRLNLSHEKLNKLNLLATLNDIGKVTISEKILNKPGKLTAEEAVEFIKLLEEEEK